jgi:uncharacterized membrane protein YqiK
MKITKSQLKQLIKEELSTVLEQADVDAIEHVRRRQAELDRASAEAAAKEKYGAKPAEIDPTLGKALGAEIRVGPGETKMIDLLSDIRGLMQQLVQKP